MTAGVLATTLAAAALSLASTNLGAIARNNYVASDPSMNLHVSNFKKLDGVNKLTIFVPSYFKLRVMV